MFKMLFEAERLLLLLADRLEGEGERGVPGTCWRYCWEKERFGVDGGLVLLLGLDEEEEEEEDGPVTEPVRVG